LSVAVVAGLVWRRNAGVAGSVPDDTEEMIIS